MEEIMQRNSKERYFINGKNTIQKERLVTYSSKKSQLFKVIGKILLKERSNENKNKKGEWKKGRERKVKHIKMF